MRIRELIASSSPPAALLALAREIAVFYPELVRRPPTLAEERLLDIARAYGHAAGHFGIEGMRSLLEAVEALDDERLNAAALLDRVWSGVPVGAEPEPRQARDPLEWIDLAIDRGVRLAEPPALPGSPDWRPR